MFRFVVYAWFAILLASAPLSADKPTSAEDTRVKAKKKDGKRDPMPGLTAGREAAALAFVREHHPELADLLIQLKQRHHREYQKAVGDLFRTSEKLAQFHERDQERYQHELLAWKAKSRIQLLAARLQMSPDDGELKSLLKEALLEQVDLQTARLNYERSRFTERIERLDAQLQRLEANRDDLVERQLDSLLRDKSEDAVSRKAKLKGAAAGRPAKDK